MGFQRFPTAWKVRAGQEPMWASVLQQVLDFSELLGASMKLKVLQFSREKRAVGPHAICTTISSCPWRRVLTQTHQGERSFFGGCNLRTDSHCLLKMQAVSFFAAQGVPPSPERRHSKGSRICYFMSHPLFWGQGSITPIGTASGEALAMALVHHSTGGHRAPHTLLSHLGSHGGWSLSQA